ncbi:hypothetical protein MACJ_000291 [Theileria orientalis]|uniref:CERLI1-like PH domain-containing protein n=1 Tax=Theileria orientalis TaxID=68886 RepID=A0A976M3V4_THEOR|nr:hypothetical protein MACJ_000291 [Theileria orientalis]
MMITSVIGKSLRNACCRSAELCFTECSRRVYKSIPTPSDYEPMATFCYYSGIHNHREFHLLINISDIEGDFLKRQCCIELEVGEFRIPATAIPVSKEGTLRNILCRASVRVRMCDSQVNLNIYRKQVLTKLLVSKLTLDVDRDILAKKFPQNSWYTLYNKSTKVGRIRISFYKVNNSLNVIDNVVLQQAILCANDHINSGAELKINILHPDIMLQAERLVLLSFSLEGPLIAKENYASQMRYFKTYQKGGKWYWSFWNSKPECRANRRPQGSVYLLSISTILKHPTDYTVFYVKYHTKDGPRNLFFKTVDRSRDIWTDSLYMFIHSMRDYIEHFDDLSSLNDFIN